MHTMVTPKMKECLEMMREETALTIELEEEMCTSDAQGCASAEMTIKYGTTPHKLLTALPHNEALRLLDIREEELITGVIHV